MASQDEGIGSLHELMVEIWQKPPRAGFPPRLFRGQTCEWPLLPKLFRWFTLTSDWTELSSLAAMRAFEKKLIAEFIKRAGHLLPPLPESAYDKTSLAQHYGLPTRLLDWTTNPQIALFFAVNPPDPIAPTLYVYDGVGLSTMREEPFDMPETGGIRVFQPQRHSVRAVAQAAWHTVHPLSLPRLDPDSDKNLTTFKIDPKGAWLIRRDLKVMGIDSATVFHDLARVCQEIEDEELGHQPEYGPCAKAIQAPTVRIPSEPT